jgi:hypothetical protein
MRLDELIMQAWDFKLLALNAFGNLTDLIDCDFAQCDAILRFLDVHSDHLIKNFRVGTIWDFKLSQRCEACATKPFGSRTILRSQCIDHVFDYLNDDLEGLEYVRKQSSYLRRVTFSKKTYLKLHHLFQTEKCDRKSFLPSESFFGSISTTLDVTDRNSSVADRHPLMWKLVSSPSGDRPLETMMDKCDYRGLFNAFFEPPIVQGIEPPKKFCSRFPINLYENERYELAENQSSRQYPVTLDEQPACSLSSRSTLNNSHHFRSIFSVLESVIHPPSQKTALKDGRLRMEAEYLSCTNY